MGFYFIYIYNNIKEIGHSPLPRDGIIRLSGALLGPKRGESPLLCFPGTGWQMAEGVYVHVLGSNKNFSQFSLDILLALSYSPDGGAMKTVAAFSVDTDRLIDLKRSCATYRISLSSYIDYLLETAPPVNEELAQKLTARKLGKTVEELNSMAVKKPVYEVLAKGWHFHEADNKVIVACIGKGCDKARVACPDYYEDEDGNIHSAHTDKMLWPAV